MTPISAATKAATNLQVSRFRMDILVPTFMSDERESGIEQAPKSLLILYEDLQKMY